MFRILVNRIDTYALKADFRKIGINFVTAAILGLLVTYISNLNFTIVFGLSWVLFAGCTLLICGLFRGNKK